MPGIAPARASSKKPDFPPSPPPARASPSRWVIRTASASPRRRCWQSSRASPDACAIPVTADLEGGYGDAASNRCGLVDAGAVGLNLEDAGGDVAEHVRTIATVRRVGPRPGGGSRDQRAHRSLSVPDSEIRPRVSSAPATGCGPTSMPGADCVFIPGITDEETIRRFVEALRFPLNILAIAGAPCRSSACSELGVARVTVGSGIARAAMGLTRRIAKELQSTGSYAGMLEDAISYAEANALFPGEVERARRIPPLPHKFAIFGGT